MRIVRRTILIFAALLSACAAPNGTPAGQSAPPQSAGPKLSVERTSSAVPAIEAPLQLQVDLYQLSVPLGTISRNPQFWKRVDEECVNVTTYDLLYKNGIRVGEAPIAEWEYFKQLMEAHPAVTNANTLVGAQGKPIELPMRKDVAVQDIFYFDANNQLQGRTYVQSENILALTIQSAPRKPDTMRLALCPMVRGLRKRLEYSTMNNELGEVTYLHPERLYDCNLSVDVPVNHFLIVAPSAAAKWPTSIGNTFLTFDGKTERMETVLLIVPKPLRLVITPAGK